MPEAIQGTITSPAALLGEAIRALDEAWECLDEITLSLRDADRQFVEIARDACRDQLAKLRDHALTVPAVTLTDSLAQVDAAVELADSGATRRLTYGQLVERSKKLRSVASTGNVLIRETGTDSAKVCREFTLRLIDGGAPASAKAPA